MRNIKHFSTLGNPRFEAYHKAVITYSLTLPFCERINYRQYAINAYFHKAFGQCKGIPVLRKDAI